jgi:hypothetical protein
MLSLGFFSFSTSAQTRKPKKAAKPTPAATPAPESTAQPAASIPAKRNGRPGSENSSGQNASQTYIPSYFYEFTRPGFTYSRVLIEHDEAGKGKISFVKDGFNDMFTDPISLSAVTLANINNLLAALDFVNSNENYQTDHDFSNMGDVTITYKKGGRERTAKYNWSDNKDAKALMDEYRRISNEYTWRFEIIVARDNQPLQTPGLMDLLDSYMSRNEISDPPHLVPFLTELSNDERLPLIARNHAGKLIKQAQKVKK